MNPTRLIQTAAQGEDLGRGLKKRVKWARAEQKSLCQRLRGCRMHPADPVDVNCLQRQSEDTALDGSLLLQRNSLELVTGTTCSRESRGVIALLCISRPRVYKHLSALLDEQTCLLPM